MTQFSDYDASRIRRYAAIGTGLLVFVVLRGLHRTVDSFGLPMEHEWEAMILSGVVALGSYLPAQFAAKWLVQRYPTTSATHD